MYQDTLHADTPGRPPSHSRAVAELGTLHFNVILTPLLVPLLFTKVGDIKKLSTEIHALYKTIAFLECLFGGKIGEMTKLEKES